MVASWPLVGRREELEYIAASLDSTTSSGIVLAGAEGVGKTRLARESLAQAESRGFATHWAVATKSAASIPLGALAHLLPPKAEPDSDQLALLRRGMEVLAEKGDGRRLVFGLDDVHLLDEASAALVHQVALAGIAFVVVTVRPSQQVPDSIVALWKDGAAERLDVQALSQKEVEDLATAAIGEKPDPGTSFRLWQASRGNPLFLREIILWGLESRALVKDNGIWRWRGSFAPGPRLMEVIQSRLWSLDQEEREALELIGFGEPLSLELLESLTIDEPIDRLERKGLLEVRRDQRRVAVRLSHPIYSEVVRASTPAIKARVLMRMLADAHETAGIKRLNDALRVAVWRLEGGGATNADLLTTASLHAIASFDFPLAERLARAAVDAGGGFDARIALADALRSQEGRGAEAETLLSDLEGAAPTAEQRAEASGLRAYNLFFGLDEGEMAQRILRHAEQAASGRPTVLKALTGQRALLAVYAGKPQEALIIAGEVVNRSDFAETLTEAHLAAASAWAISGQTEQALFACDRAIEILKQQGTGASMLTGQFLAVRFLALWLSGQLGEAEVLADNAYHLAVAQRSNDGMALMAAAAGQAALAQGRVSTATHRLREAAVLLRERDRNRFLQWVLGSLAHASALAGNSSDAEAALAEADTICTKSVGLLSVEFARSRTWVAAARGEISRARDLALAAAEAGETSGQKAFEAHALHDVARLGEPGRVAPRLAELAAQTDGLYSQAFTAHAQALYSDDAKALDEASELFERIGAMLLAAEASAEAGRAHRRDGRTASSLASNQRAEELRERCEGAMTFSLTIWRQPSPLTPREREIVSLVADGLSSREIAQRLVISVRTVDNHLHHAYSKLGVNKRNELAAVLGGGRKG